jgi:hypothetical protein
LPTSPPPDVQRLARNHRRRQQQIARKAVADTRRLWRFGDWRAVSLQVVSLMRSALAEAGRGSQMYVAATVRAWGATPDPYGTVAEHVMSASASDGRPLDTLLDVPDHTVRRLVAQGTTHDVANAEGERQLARIVATQVQDAARVATGVALANDRAVAGYIRMLTPPSCNRCIILAGVFYKYNAGFKRHPNDDCIHVPAVEVIKPPTPKDIFDSLTDEERRKAGWSGDDVRAIEDGADLNQVTNAKRALKSVTIAGREVQTTRVGTSKTALAGQRLRAAGQRRPIRLTPEAIYLEAHRNHLDREQTLEQLRLHGYIL